MSRKPSQRELLRLLRYWQPFLKLSDWTVTIAFVRKANIDTEADIMFDLLTKTAEIQVLDPRDYDHKEYIHEVQQDVELAVVHELLHLHLAPWDVRKPEQETAQEQAIEAISRALVAAKRRKASSPRKRIQLES